MKTHPALITQAATATAAGLTPVRVIGFHDGEPSIEYRLADGTLVRSARNNYDDWTELRIIDDTGTSHDVETFTARHNLDSDTLSDACRDLECAIDDLLREYIVTIPL